MATALLDNALGFPSLQQRTGQIRHLTSRRGAQPVCASSARRLSVSAPRPTTGPAWR